MKVFTKYKYAIAVFFIITKSIAQNVGIDNPLPLDKLDVNGTIRSKGLRILNNNVLEMGFGVSPKEESAGKIGYGIFTAQTLDIVGAGTAYTNRKLRFWAEGGSAFEGGATFLNKVGVGLINPNYKLHLHESVSNTAINFQLSNADAGITINDGLHIGLNPNSLVFGFAASIINKENSLLSFGTNNLPHMTINEVGNVGIGTLDPNYKLKIVGPDKTKLLSVRNAESDAFGIDIFGASPDGVNIVSHGNVGKDGPQPGTSLINTHNGTFLGKWGYDNTGAEMEASEQTINHATPTRLDFGNPVFLHSNFGLAHAFGIEIADANKDQFNVVADGIYLIDFQVNWFDPDFDVGGTGLRNGKILVRVNGVTRREFKSDLYIREHCFIKCNTFDYITVEAYHEHCAELPPICIVGISRIVTSARVTVVKF